MQGLIDQEPCRAPPARIRVRLHGIDGDVNSREAERFSPSREFTESAPYQEPVNDPVDVQLHGMGVLRATICDPTGRLEVEVAEHVRQQELEEEDDFHASRRRDGQRSRIEIQELVYAVEPRCT